MPGRLDQLRLEVELGRYDRLRSWPAEVRSAALGLWLLPTCDDAEELERALMGAQVKASWLLPFVHTGVTDEALRVLARRTGSQLIEHVGALTARQLSMLAREQLVEPRVLIARLRARGASRMVVRALLALLEGMYRRGVSLEQLYRYVAAEGQLSGDVSLEVQRMALEMQLAPEVRALLMYLAPQSSAPAVAMLETEMLPASIALASRRVFSGVRLLVAREGEVRQLARVTRSASQRELLWLASRVTFLSTSVARSFLDRLSRSSRELLPLLVAELRPMTLALRLTSGFTPEDWLRFAEQLDRRGALLEALTAALTDQAAVAQLGGLLNAWERLSAHNAGKTEPCVESYST